jgi:hypothetical protein
VPAMEGEEKDLNCQFAAPWDHRVCRVMGPGRRGKTTDAEGASYRSRRRSIFHCAARRREGPRPAREPSRPGRERRQVSAVVSADAVASCWLG